MRHSSMANSYFSPGPRRAAKVDDLFGSIASRYDLVNDLQSLGMHRLWKRRVAQWTRLTPGDRALDLCCGTGDLAFRLAARGARVVGADFSASMLSIARRRSQGLPHTHTPRPCPATPRWIRADALRLPFPDAQFHAVTVGYGLRNLTCVQSGLAEIFRVLRPGGRLVVLDFGKPRSPTWRALAFAYLRWAVPVCGAWCGGDRAAYAYILESLEPYPGQDGVAHLMAGAGFSQLCILEFLGGAMSVNYGEKQPA
jgi:demethylmenaquinone methyltransferase/2-methoxy-6-polyprenyl-1,4-benzoquinol methylase